MYGTEVVPSLSQHTLSLRERECVRSEVLFESTHIEVQLQGSYPNYEFIKDVLS